MWGFSPAKIFKSIGRKVSVSPKAAQPKSKNEPPSITKKSDRRLTAKQSETLFGPEVSIHKAKRLLADNNIDDKKLYNLLPKEEAQALADNRFRIVTRDPNTGMKKFSSEKFAASDGRIVNAETKKNREDGIVQKLIQNKRIENPHDAEKDSWVARIPIIGHAYRGINAVENTIRRQYHRYMGTKGVVPPLVKLPFTAAYDVVDTIAGFSRAEKKDAQEALKSFNAAEQTKDSARRLFAAKAAQAKAIEAAKMGAMPQTNSEAA